MKKSLVLFCFLFLGLSLNIHASDFNHLTLTHEYFDHDKIVRVYQTDSGTRVVSSIGIDSYLASSIRSSSDPLVTAKKKLMLAYMVLDLDERLKTLNYKRLPQHNVERITIDPSLKHEIDSDMKIAIDYAKKTIKKSDLASLRLSFSEHSLYYVDYNELSDVMIGNDGHLTETKNTIYEEGKEGEKKPLLPILSLFGFILILFITVFYFKKKRR